MKAYKIPAYIILYLLVLFSAGLFFSPAYLKDFPKLDTYEGNLAFSGEKAYENLKTLTNEYPGRVVGSKTGRAAADWVAEQFKSLGLKTSLEEFGCVSADAFKIADPYEYMKNCYIKRAKGINVFAVSKGKNEQCIIVGAHRDVTPNTIQGAEDNGSGTAAMLELARVLSKENHYYTYVFASFDAEETGLGGSDHFVESHGDMPVKLAFVLDMVGCKGKEDIGLYAYMTARGASPLWTTALADNITRARGQKLFYEEDFNGLGMFVKMFLHKTAGVVYTDTNAFVNMNIPSIGIDAAAEQSGGRAIHNKTDIIGQIDPTVLQSTGEFTEQYIKSVELNNFKGVLSTTNYLIYDGKLMYPLPVILFTIFTFIMIFGYFILSAIDLIRDWKSFLLYMRREIVFVAANIILAVLVGAFGQLLRIEAVQTLSLPIIILMELAVFVLGMTAIVIVRKKSLRRSPLKYWEDKDKQSVFLNMIYTITFIVLVFCFNPFIAIASLFFPVLLMGRVVFRKLASRIIWITIAAIWAVVQVLITLTLLSMPYSFDMGSPLSSVLVSINILLITITFTYIISVPKGRRDCSNAAGKAPEAGEHIIYTQL